MSKNAPSLLVLACYNTITFAAELMQIPGKQNRLVPAKTASILPKVLRFQSRRDIIANKVQYCSVLRDIYIVIVPTYVFQEDVLRDAKIHGKICFEPLAL